MKTLEIFAAATPSKRIINGYVMVDNILTLCDVKFHSIDTHSGDITYLVTVKGDKEETKLMTNVHVFASVDNYKKGLEYGETFELVRFVKNVINLLDIPATICVDKDNAELFLLSYKYENGEVKCVKKFSPIIYDDKEKNSFEFEGLYKSREEVFAWNDIKVSENGKEYVKEGILKALSLTDEQKALVDEFMAMKQKLTDNNISVVYDNDYETLNFINTSNYDLENQYLPDGLKHNEDEYETIPDGVIDSLEKLHQTKVVYDIYRMCDGQYYVRKK